MTQQQQQQQQAGRVPGPCQVVISPQPWRWEHDGDHCAVWGYAGCTVPALVARVYGDADARLIAAAPELLDICQEIAGAGCDLLDSERRMRLYHAITRAGGTL